MQAIVRDCGSSGRTFKSALLFAAPDPNENLYDKAREVLAWEDVDADEETKKRIDESQLSLLSRNLKNAKRDLDEAVFRAYKHLYLLGKDNKLRHVDLGSITSSAAGSLVEVYLQRLGSNGGLDEIVDMVLARKLATYWPASMVEWSTKAVRNAFYSSPQLPRLLNADAIRRTICDGVNQGLVGYASKGTSGRLKLEKLKESLVDQDVEISDDMFILRGEDAQKLREPPRLESLRIQPEHVTLKPGDQASFSCTATDQYGQPFPMPAASWTATGGTITPGALFTAGPNGGAYTVRADAGSHSAIAEVRIDATADPGDAKLLSGHATIRWHGVVPTQKWMNFYTKVLSKHATNPDLQLEVSFEVKVPRDQADAKAAETKSALRELGLDDGASAH